jgi:heme/copper-type cytochrome/quinol oxidase subunit 2
MGRNQPFGQAKAVARIWLGIFLLLLLRCQQSRLQRRWRRQAQPKGNNEMAHLWTATPRWLLIAPQLEAVF